MLDLLAEVLPMITGIVRFVRFVRFARIAGFGAEADA